MGFLTSVFSVGRFLSSMIFGWMCDRYSFRTVYLVSSAVCLVGNFFYLLADVHVAKSKHLLALSRFIVGFGAGNRSVCRANVAAMTSVEQRLKYITILATVVFLGYALTPGFGSLVADVDTWVLGLHLNKYTAPGVILIALNTLTIVLMLTLFAEDIGKDDAPPNSAPSVPTKDLSSSKTNVPEHLVRIGVGVFIMLNFNARGILSVFETVNVPLFLEATGNDPGSKAAVVEASTFQFYLGCLGLLSYFSIEVYRHRISDVSWLLLGFAMLGVGNLVLVFAPAQMSLAQLIVGELFVWSIGCPITTAVVVATFSKILGGRPQGTLMGLLGSAGSVSRMALPLLPSILPSLTPLFVIDVILCVVSCVGLYWYDRRVRQWRNRNSNVLEEDLLLLDGPGSPRSPIHMEAK